MGLTNCTKKIWPSVSNCIPVLCRLITRDVYELLAGAIEAALQNKSLVIKNVAVTNLSYNLCMQTRTSAANIFSVITSVFPAA